MESIERACERLVIEFAQIIDSQDYARLRDVFTDLATFARPTDPDAVIVGVEAIIASYSARPKTRLTQHLCSNFRVTVESADRAAGSSRVLLILADAAEGATPGKGRKASGQLIGVFEDQFQRTPQGWRIRQRRGRLLFHV